MLAEERMIDVMGNFCPGTDLAVTHEKTLVVLVYVEGHAAACRLTRIVVLR